MSVPRCRYTRHRFFFTTKVLSSTDLEASMDPPGVSCIMLKSLHRRGKDYDDDDDKESDVSWARMSTPPRRRHRDSITFLINPRWRDVLVKLSSRINNNGAKCAGTLALRSITCDCQLLRAPSVLIGRADETEPRRTWGLWAIGARRDEGRDTRA